MKYTYTYTKTPNHHRLWSNRPQSKPKTINNTWKRSFLIEYENYIKSASTIASQFIFQPDSKEKER